MLLKLSVTRNNFPQSYECSSYRELTVVSYLLDFITYTSQFIKVLFHKTYTTYLLPLNWIDIHCSVCRTNCETSKTTAESEEFSCSFISYRIFKHFFQISSDEVWFLREQLLLFNLFGTLKTHDLKRRSKRLIQGWRKIKSG